MKNEPEALAAVVATHKYDTPTESQNFHIRLEDPIGQQALRRALNAAGIVAIVTPASHERNGVILTDLLAYITWESQTENYNCDGSCREVGNPPHRTYHELSAEQRDRFLNKVIDYMNHARSEAELDLQSVSDPGPPVAVHPCD